MTERCSTTATGTNLSSNVAYHLSTVQNFSKNYFFMFQKSVLATLFTRTWEPRNLILYKTVRIKIRDYFALVTSFKLKKPPYRNVGLRWRALHVTHEDGKILRFFVFVCTRSRRISQFSVSSAHRELRWRRIFRSHLCPVVYTSCTISLRNHATVEDW